MKSKSLAVVVVFTLSTLLFGKENAMSSDRSAESEVLKLEQSFISAWNAGDAAGAARVYAEDGLRVGASGDISHGRGEIQTAFEKLFHVLKGATVQFTPTIRLISSDVVLSEGPITITPGDGRPSFDGYAVDIWKKSGGKWELIEGHPKLYPPKK